MRRLCTEIALAPLAKTAVRELLSRELQQQELPSRLASFVHRRSEGNPLFVIAILEHLIARDYLVPEETGDLVRWVQTAPDEEMEASVPDGLAQMIELEISRLNEQEQRMLEAGSLMNVAFPSWAVAAALEMDPAEAEEACQELARRLYFVERAGEDVVVAEPSSAKEEEDSGAHEGDDVALLVGVHAGRDEEPDLVKDEWTSENGPADKRCLQIKVEAIGRMSEVQRNAKFVERCLNETIQPFMEGIGYYKADEQIDSGVDEAFAQFTEVLHQAHAWKLCPI